MHRPAHPFSKDQNLSYLTVGMAFWMGGLVLNGIAYGTSEPALVTLIFMVLGGIPLLWSQESEGVERRMYVLAFSTMWFMAGIAAVYSNLLDDFEQNYSDAAGFYQASIDGTHQMSLMDIADSSVGALAIYFWGLSYDLFRALGLGDGKYVGIGLNITTVSLTGVVAVKIVKLVHGNDQSRLDRLIFIFVSCGLFWLFAATHLRDAFGLIFITLLIFFWVKLLVAQTISAMVVVLIATVLLTPILTLLRSEFIYVPSALILSAIASTLMAAKKPKHSKTMEGMAQHFAILLGLLLVLVLAGTYFDAIVESFEYRNEGYKKFSEDEAESSSLGDRYIVQASWPIRALFGSMYLFVYPIPVWSGFQLEAVYHLYKSANALLLYAVIPLFVLGAYRILRDKSTRAPVLVFLLISFLGFTVAVALTSLETRHWGAFLVPMMVICTVPDLENPVDRISYRRLLKIFLTLAIGGHILWALVKFGY